MQQSVWSNIKSMWRWLTHGLWCWGKVLLVCRVPFVSAVGGGLLLNFSQAKDLFADLGLVWWQWIAFFALLFGWAWIVHTVARRALQHDDWVIESHVKGGLTAPRRRALIREFRAPAEWIPRLLGLFLLLSVTWAIYKSGVNLLTAADLPEISAAYDGTSLLWKIGLLLTALYGALVWKRRDWRGYLAQRSQWMPPADAPLLAGTWVFPYNLKKRTSGSLAKRGVERFDLVLLAIAGAITIAFVLAILAPHIVAGLFPRPLIAPVLFGGGVLFFGEIAAYSHFRRTPFLLVVILVMVTLQFLAERFHDIRWVKALAAESAQIDIVKAIDRWKAANRTSDGKYPRPIIVAGAGGASRAGFMTASVVGAMIDYGLTGPSTTGSVRNRIFAISAVSGSSVGAAVVRAALADAAAGETPDKPPCKKLVAGEESAWFGSLAVRQDKTIFRPHESWRDCLQQLMAGDFLSPVVVGLGYRDNSPFLSAFGFDMDDRAALLEQAFERRYNQIAGGGTKVCGANDNTGLCRRVGYHPDPGAKKVWLPLLFLNSSSGVTGRRVMISDVASGSVYKSTPRDGTLLSEVFDIQEMRGSKRNKCYLSRFTKILDLGDVDGTFRWLGLAPEHCPNDAEKQDTAMRLSTAAAISARFPVISPYATVRDATHDVVDRLVDGGYFENGGLATAADVVWALRAAELDPVVVWVTNDPLVEADGDRKITGPGERPDLPGNASEQLSGGFTAILFALYQTRQGHQAGSVNYVKSSLVQGGSRYFEIGVRPLDNFDGDLCRKADQKEDKLVKAANPKRSAVLKDVSMSWWVSQPVQAYLDGQLCVPENTAKLVCELKGGGLAAPGAC